MTHSLVTGTLPRKTKLSKSLILVGLLLATVTNTASAQTTERWFQVELIAFARQAHDQLEHWDKDIKPAYPLNWVELKDPTAATTSAAGENTDVTTDGGSAQESDAMRDPARSPFYLLPRADRKLANHASALARDSRYRVLFHQTWRQPTKSLKSAPAILIYGGNTYGEHTELEGSITISLSHLLQINTRLWLTQFEINYGQAPSGWPPLPAQPQQLKKALLEQVRNAEDLTSLPTQPGSWSLPAEPLTDIISETSAPFLPQRIVMMNEERRMRSNEIHYIDHPLFGLIIQLTPYKVPTSPSPAD
jgi:hypothetical protein